MNAHRFDNLTRRLTPGMGRRQALAVGGGALSSVLLGRSAVVAGCKRVGRKCDKNKDCCDGARCKGGKRGKCRCKSGLSECNGEKACKNLNTDNNHCSACNSVCPELFNFCVAGDCRSCPAGANHCVSPPSNCEGRFDCFCMKRLADGVATCGNQPRCNQPCSDDADCPSSTIFCASGGDACCPESAGEGRCAELCAA